MQGQIGLIDELEEVAKVEAAKIAWMLYKDHEHMEICTIKKWFIQKTFYLSDLKPAFVFLFGPEPE